MNQFKPSPKILVAPLDWGLGHATRCIPVINQLVADKCTVLIAASGKTKKLLMEEFPGLKFLELSGYNIQYASSGWGLPFKIVAQIPKLISAIKKENNWLKEMAAKENIDVVISDNRYGLHHPKIYSVFITHQLLIKAPLKMVEAILQKINYQYIQKFNECWVPDAAGETNLSGVLSHPPMLPTIQMHYIGKLSRLQPTENFKEGNHLLILLSGPEPQRSLLEKQLLEEVQDYSNKVIIVRGLPDQTESLSVNNNVTVHNHLPAADLEQKIKEATLIISRCGYSTVMDLTTLKKKSILIPTPGQTEQEYLAEHLMKKNFALCIPQKKFQLKQALELAQSFNYQFDEHQNSNLRIVTANLVKKINSQKNQP